MDRSESEILLQAFDIQSKFKLQTHPIVLTGQGNKNASA